MANFTNQMNKSSSSNYYQAAKDMAARSNVQASAYSVDAATMALKGFHYSTCGAGGTSPISVGPGGGFEVSTGIPSPPPSPRAAPHEPSSQQQTEEQQQPAVRPGLKARQRSVDAAYNITEESERLFCKTLSAVFLGEGNSADQDSLVMGMRNKNNNNQNVKDTNNGRQRRLGRHDSGALLPTPPPSVGPDGFIDDDDVVMSNPSTAFVSEWIEIWDYAGGVRFRGFVAERDSTRALFIFFDSSVIGKDLKQGLMSLLELAAGDDFECSKLTVCVDRNANAEDIKDLSRDLGWVGFELATLDEWSDTPACISDRWLFLEMEV